MPLALPVCLSYERNIYFRRCTSSDKCRKSMTTADFSIDELIRKDAPGSTGSTATGTSGQRSLVDIVDRSGSVWRQRDSSAHHETSSILFLANSSSERNDMQCCHHLPGSLSLETKTKTYSAVQNNVKEFHQWRETFFPVCPGFRRGCI